MGKMRVLDLVNANVTTKTKIPANDCPPSLVRGTCGNYDNGSYFVIGELEVYPDGTLKFIFCTDYNNSLSQFTRYDSIGKASAQVIWFIE